MQISFRHLTYSEIEERTTWLDKNVGLRQYYMHTAKGGHGWRYMIKDRIVQIEDEQWAAMFILKFGCH